MVEATEDMEKLVFWENLHLALDDILGGKTQKEEYDWGVKGKTGFKMWKVGGGALIQIKRFEE